MFLQQSATLLFGVLFSIQPPQACYGRAAFILDDYTPHITSQIHVVGFNFVAQDVEHPLPKFLGHLPAFVILKRVGDWNIDEAALS